MGGAGTGVGFTFACFFGGAAVGVATGRSAFFGAGVGAGVGATVLRLTMAGPASGLGVSSFGFERW